jgi:hypothetical protein
VRLLALLARSARWRCFRSLFGPACLLRVADPLAGLGAHLAAAASWPHGRVARCIFGRAGSAPAAWPLRRTATLGAAESGEGAVDGRDLFGEFSKALPGSECCPFVEVGRLSFGQNTCSYLCQTNPDVTG